MLCEAGLASFSLFVFLLVGAALLLCGIARSGVKLVAAAATASRYHAGKS